MVLRYGIFLVLGLCAADGSEPSRSHCAGPEMVEGDTALAQGRHAAAAAAYEAGLTKLQTGAAEPNERTIPCLMDRLATALSRMGKWGEATSWSLRAVESSRTTPPNQTTVIIANHTALLYLEAGDLAAAEDWSREAVRISGETHPADHPDLQLIWTTLACIHVQRGAIDRAEPLFRSALYNIEKNLGPRHVEAGLAAANLAEVYREQHRPEAAILMFSKAISILETSPEWAGRQILLARSGLMVSCLETGREAEAALLATAILGGLDGVFVTEDQTLATILLNLAVVRLSQRDIAGARNLCDRALGILEKLFGKESPRMIHTLRTSAAIARSAKDNREAKRIDARIKTLLQTANRQ